MALAPSRASRGAAPLLVVAVVVSGLAGCAWPADDLGGRIDRALDAAMHALIAAQAPDGAWRSPTYGVFNDGLSLTPPVLKAVAFGPDVDGSRAARRRGAAYLAGRVRPDGSIDDGPTGLTYPVYAASAAVIALSRVDIAEGRRARDAWLRELRRRQLTEELGWGPSDPAFGGWGYSIEPPSGPGSGRPDGGHVDADLSSTLFAVGALRIAGADADDPAIRSALAFVIRCQNFAEDDREADPAVDDGGFFFTPTDPVRNKAGAAGPDRLGRTRYHSYGSATADGLRALLRCGLPPGHPRVRAARGWLERHFRPDSNPGVFEPARAVERDATYYYYAWSTAHAFRALGLVEVRSGDRKVAWTDELARELLRRQRADGTWVNRFTASKEDDPLIATSFAAGALAICRAMTAGPPRIDEGCRARLRRPGRRSLARILLRLRRRNEPVVPATPRSVRAAWGRHPPRRAGPPKPGPKGTASPVPARRKGRASYTDRTGTSQARRAPLMLRVLPSLDHQPRCCNSPASALS